MRSRKFAFYSSKTLQNTTPVNKYTYFSGIQQHVSIPELNIGAYHTVTYKFKRQFGGKAYEYTFGNAGTNPKIGFGGGTGLMNGYRPYAGGPLIGQAIGYVPAEHDNIWHHFAVVRNGTTSYFYWNGVLKQTYSFSGLNDTTLNMIGCAQNLQEGFKGGMKEVKFFNKVMTQDEVVADMDKVYTAPAPNLVGYYRLNGDCLDSSGNGRHGVLKFDASFKED